MKIAIVHNNSKTVLMQDELQVPLQEITNVEDATCMSVHLADCMDYIPSEERDKLLSIAIKKMRYGGEITISGTDIYSIASALINGRIDINSINKVLYMNRLSSDTINNVVGNLKNKGLEIINTKVDGYFYSIKAKRKKNA